MTSQAGIPEELVVGVGGWGVAVVSSWSFTHDGKVPVLVLGAQLDTWLSMAILISCLPPALQHSEFTSALLVHAEER